MEHEIKDLVQKANEAVSGLTDPELKKIAFQSVLNKLLEEKGDAKNKIVRLKNKSKVSRPTQRIKTSKDDEIVGQLLKKINRTKYPEVHKIKKALDKSLFILKIAKDDLGANGLIPSQIVAILSEAFRTKITKEAISMALGGATQYTDRTETTINGAKTYLYKIMPGGEEYIKKIISSKEGKD